jgi:hypothetical protein
MQLVKRRKPEEKESQTAAHGGELSNITSARGHKNHAIFPLGLTGSQIYSREHKEQKKLTDTHSQTIGKERKSHW